MSAQKKKTPLIATVAAILLVIAGAVAYFTNKTTGTAPQEATETVAAVEEQEAPTDISTASGEATEKTAPNDAPKTTVKEGELVVEPGNPVVAKVDGKDITRVDVYRFIQTMPQNMQEMPATAVYPIAMDQVINTRIVQTQAESAKIEDTPEFKRELDIVKQQITRNLYLQKQVDAKITDKMVKDAYNDYAKKIPNVEERRARHILVETEAKAKAIVEKLKKGGKFEELASELSIGPTATKGGDLGYFAKTEMVPEFANAAFGMEKNSILQTPVKTQFGWHVIQVIDIRQRPKPTMEQMTPALRAELSRTALDDLIKKWRKDAKIEQFDINGNPLQKGANSTGLVPAAKAE